MQREIMQLKPYLSGNEHAKIKAKVAKERAEAADFLMRILQDYDFISGAEAACHLKATLANLQQMGAATVKSPNKNKAKKTKAKVGYGRRGGRRQQTLNAAVPRNDHGKGGHAVKYLKSKALSPTIELSVNELMNEAIRREQEEDQQRLELTRTALERERMRPLATPLRRSRPGTAASQYSSRPNTGLQSRTGTPHSSSMTLRGQKNNDNFKHTQSTPRLGVESPSGAASSQGHTSTFKSERVVDSQGILVSESDINGRDLFVPQAMYVCFNSFVLSLCLLGNFSLYRLRQTLQFFSKV